VTVRRSEPEHGDERCGLEASNARWKDGVQDTEKVGPRTIGPRRVSRSPDGADAGNRVRCLCGGFDVDGRLLASGPPGPRAWPLPPSG